MKSETSPPSSPQEDLREAGIDSEAVDEALTSTAVDFVLTMLSSASTDVIDPKHWWTRARTALETSSQATSWPEMVSRFGAKLQIEALTERSAKSISSIGEFLGKENLFKRFRSLCKRDALYITAMAQARRAEQREARQS